MISENKVIIDNMSQKGIEITCKHCGESQIYTMRSKKIPNRPKTQCSSCEKWIYIDRSLLVKNDQKDNDQRPNDQKNINKTNKPVEGPKKPEINQQSSLTKTDQMTKTPKKQREISSGQKLNPKQNIELTNYFNGLAAEVQLLGRTIPLDVKQKIVNEIFENLKNLTKGMKYYLNAWNKRYTKYLAEKPENPLIDEYQDMQETLEVLKNLKQIKQGLKNAKRKK